MLELAQCGPCYGLQRRSRPHTFRKGKRWVTGVGALGDAGKGRRQATFPRLLVHERRDLARPTRAARTSICRAKVDSAVHDARLATSTIRVYKTPRKAAGSSDSGFRDRPRAPWGGRAWALVPICCGHSSLAEAIPVRNSRTQDGAEST